MKRILALVALALVLVVGGGVLAQDDTMTYTVELGGDAELGPFLVGADGMTLYIFTNDTPGLSNCYDQCATNWPPLLVEDGEAPTQGAGVSGELGVITRTDGTRQVTYNGWPLYYWVNDAAPGDTTGHEVGGVWFVASTPDVGLAGNADLGAFLVGADGMTLYTFTNDAEGVSNCYDQCATNWPPLVVDSADDLFVQPGLVGDYGVTERTDGSLQVTLNGWPLYYWVNDAAPGDATGHEVGGVWFVAKLPTLNSVETEEHGAILVGANGMTLYLFLNDTAGLSVCYDQCAVNWPPLLVAAGEEVEAAEGIDGDIAIIERTDGTYQVSYNGQPLYYWIQDLVPGDTTGDSVGDVWYVVVP